jgi:GNAT superfamily N-acetyltransferase
VRVEVATPDDAAEIAALGRVLHDTSNYAGIPYNEAKVADLMRVLAGGSGVIFVVRHESAIVGGIAGAVAPHWFSDELHGFEYSFFLLPAARAAMSPAVKLLNAFKTWCASRGAKSVRIGITTGIHTDRTAGLYRRLGFEDAGLLFQLELSDGN